MADKTLLMLLDDVRAKTLNELKDLDETHARWALARIAELVPLAWWARVHGDGILDREGPGHRAPRCPRVG